MAGNTLQVGADNALRVKSDGLVVAGASDPCCCTSTETCTYCLSGSAPSTYRVTFSGWTACVCSVYGDTTISVTSGTLDGTYDLEYVGTSGGFCRWSGTFEGISTSFWDTTVDPAGGSCENTPTETATTFTITLAIGLSSGSYLIAIAASPDLVGDEVCNNFFTGLFDNGGTKIDCDDIADLDNEITECAANSGFCEEPYGYGGTVAIAGV